MSELINLLQSTDANVAVTISLQDLREVATQFAEQVVERLRSAMPPTPANGKDDLLTQKEVCAMLGVTKQTLWRWDKMDYLKKVRVGNAVRYRRADVEQLRHNDKS